MYAIYFVCYGTSMLITYIIHLSLREPLQSHHHHHHHHHHHDHYQQQQQQNQNESEFCTERCSENKERPNENTPQDADTADGDVDCTWSEWSQWSDCTVTCGQGVRLRHRTVLKSRFDNCSIDDSLQQEVCSAQSPCHFGNGILFSSYQFLFGGESVENPSQTSDDVDNMAPNEPDSFDGSSGGGDERLHNRPSHLPDAKPSRVVNEFKWSSHRDRFKPPPTGNEHQQQQQQQQQSDDGSQFCSSFDCSSPNTPEDKVPRFWGALNEEIRDQKDDDADQENHQHQQQHQSSQGNSKTDKENQKHEQKHHHRHEKHQSDDSSKNRRHQYQGRSSSFGGGSSGGERPADDGSDVEDEKSDPHQHDDDDEFGQRDNKQHENHGNDDDDGEDGEGQEECFGDDDEGDGDDEPGESGGDDDFEDEDQWEASGDEENNDDDDNRKEKRKRSIPEDEELDDKEDGEMDEEETEEEAKTKRKKRKRRKRRKLLIKSRNLSSKLKNVAVNSSNNTSCLDGTASQQPVSDAQHFGGTSEDTGLLTPSVADVHPVSDRATVTDFIEYQNLPTISMETADADAVAEKTTTETLKISSF